MPKNDFVQIKKDKDGTTFLHVKGKIFKLIINNATKHQYTLIDTKDNSKIKITFDPKELALTTEYGDKFFLKHVIVNKKEHSVKANTLAFFNSLYDFLSNNIIELISFLVAGGTIAILFYLLGYLNGTITNNITQIHYNQIQNPEPVCLKQIPMLTYPTSNYDDVYNDNIKDLWKNNICLSNTIDSLKRDILHIKNVKSELATNVNKLQLESLNAHDLLDKYKNDNAVIEDLFYTQRNLSLSFNEKIKELESKYITDSTLTMKEKQDLNNEIERLKNLNENLTIEFKNLQQVHKTLNEKISQLEANNQKLLTDTLSLHGDNLNLKEETEYLNQKNKYLSDTKDFYETLAHAKDIEIENLKKTYNDAINEYKLNKDKEFKDSLYIITDNMREDFKRRFEVQKKSYETKMKKALEAQIKKLDKKYMNTIHELHSRLIESEESRFKEVFLEYKQPVFIVSNTYPSTVSYDAKNLLLLDPKLKGYFDVLAREFTNTLNNRTSESDVAPDVTLHLKKIIALKSGTTSVSPLLDDELLSITLFNIRKVKNRVTQRVTIKDFVYIINKIPNQILQSILNNGTVSQISFNVTNTGDAAVRVENNITVTSEANQEIYSNGTVPIYSNTTVTAILQTTDSSIVVSVPIDTTDGVLSKIVSPTPTYTSDNNVVSITQQMIKPTEPVVVQQVSDTAIYKAQSGSEFVDRLMYLKQLRINNETPPINATYIEGLYVKHKRETPLSKDVTNVFGLYRNNDFRDFFRTDSIAANETILMKMILDTRTDFPELNKIKTIDDTKVLLYEDLWEYIQLPESDYPVLFSSKSEKEFLSKQYDKIPELRPTIQQMFLFFLKTLNEPMNHPVIIGNDDNIINQPINNNQYSNSELKKTINKKKSDRNNILLLN
jgi:hypothetical protein